MTGWADQAGTSCLLVSTLTILTGGSTLLSSLGSGLPFKSYKTFVLRHPKRIPTFIFHHKADQLILAIFSCNDDDDGSNQLAKPANNRLFFKWGKLGRSHVQRLEVIINSHMMYKMIKNAKYISRLHKLSPLKMLPQ